MSEEKTALDMLMFDVPDELLEEMRKHEEELLKEEEEAKEEVMKFDEELCELLFKVEDTILTRERNEVYESALRRVRRMEKLLGCPKRRRKRWKASKTSSSEARTSSSQ